MVSQLPRGVCFMAIGCSFLEISRVFPFYDFWAVMCMLGNQEGVHGVSHPLKTLESGPRYPCSNCRVGC